MKLLVLGGTQFIGRHIVELALADGHTVSVFNRGRSADPLPPQVERLRGDRDAGADGVRALEGRRWDACIDVSGYTTTQLRATAQVLAKRTCRYVYVSAVMAYGDPLLRPVREWHPRVAPWTGEVRNTDAVDGTNYGALKVANEDLVGVYFPGRCTVLRPQIVAGPHDPSARVGWWLQRAARSGPTLAPGDGRDHVQFVDVRDLARFALHLIAAERGGAFNVAGPRMTWSAFVGLLGLRQPVWVPAALLKQEGVTAAELPLFRAEHGPLAGLMDVSGERALAAGLLLTDPALTLRDQRATPVATTPPERLTPARERTLVERALRGRDAGGAG